jgi:hypothetical protein
MTTRLGFRPRPLDHNRELLIVRDEAELDREDAQREQGANGHDCQEKVCKPQADECERREQEAVMLLHD